MTYAKIFPFKASGILTILMALVFLSVIAPAVEAQTVKMTFEFTDECDDQFTPEIEFYLKSNPEKLWGTYWLQYYNKPLKTKINCEEDSQICFGAWLEDSTWGCGKKCTEACKGACYTCKATTVSIGLQCNR